MTGSDDSSKAGAPPTEWDAASYHHLSAPQFSWGKKVIARLRLEGNETVIDAGSGWGGSRPDYLRTCRAGASWP
jgi:cyclopropane fatty-acyl-phospholipid synthase-like methyltransferase